MRLVLRDEVLPKMELPRGVDNSISSLSYYALVLIGLMVALAAAGFETSQFAIIFGALGVGIGFGLQNVVNNFVSGLILMFERPIQPGDVVEVSGTSGKVRAIGMRATTLTTFEGADVIVPNGTLLSEKLINWTLSDMNRRIDVEVGVAYGSDPRRVLALLREVALGTPGISRGAGASDRLQGLRRQLARLQHPRLDQRLRRLGDDPHRNDGARLRSAGEGRHRDPVPAAGHAHPQRVA